MSLTLSDSLRFPTAPSRGWRPLLRAKVMMRQHAAPQFLLLLGLWWVSDMVARTLDLPVPGSILGLLVALGLLWSGVMPAKMLNRGAGLLLAHLMLFFVPAMLALLEHPELISLTGLKVLIAIMTGTIVVMSGTALVVDFCIKRALRRA